jgi:hypothetical protein
MRGYLYTSVPLAPGDTYQDYDGHTAITAGPAELVVGKQWNDHWYSVSRSLD